MRQNRRASCGGVGSYGEIVAASQIIISENGMGVRAAASGEPDLEATLTRRRHFCFIYLSHLVVEHTIEILD